jgi:hypothetical protein
MEILEEFDFTARPSRSRYADAVTALVDNGAHAVRLARGTDFPDNLKMDTVQSAVTTQIRKAGKRARTYKVDDDTLVVGLRPDHSPARRRGGERAAVAA